MSAADTAITPDGAEYFLKDFVRAGWLSTGTYEFPFTPDGLKQIFGTWGDDPVAEFTAAINELKISGKIQGYTFRQHPNHGRGKILEFTLSAEVNSALASRV